MKFLQNNRLKSAYKKKNDIVYISFSIFSVIISMKFLLNNVINSYKFNILKNIDSIISSKITNYTNFIEKNPKLQLTLLGNYLKHHIKFSIISINYLKRVSWPSKKNLLRKQNKLNNKKKREKYMEKFQRLSKKKRELFKRDKSNLIFSDFLKRTLLLKYYGLSIHSSIGVYISYMSSFSEKNRRKFIDRKNYQKEILKETTRSLLFKILTINNNSLSIGEKCFFNIIIYGYRAFYFSLISKFLKIKEIDNINLLVCVFPKKSYNLGFKRKKVRSIKKNYKRKFNYFF